MEDKEEDVLQKQIKSHNNIAVQPIFDHRSTECERNIHGLQPNEGCSFTMQMEVVEDDVTGPSETYPTGAGEINQINDEDSGRKSHRSSKKRQTYSPSPDGSRQVKQRTKSPASKIPRKETERLYDKMPDGSPFCCDFCQSPFVCNPLRRNRHGPNHRSRHMPLPRLKIDPSTGKTLVLCNACGIAFNRPPKIPKEKKSAELTRAEKEQYLNEAKSFGADLSKQLGDPLAEHLFCPKFTSKPCACLQNFILTDVNSILEQQQDTQSPNPRALELLNLHKEAKNLSKLKCYEAGDEITQVFARKRKKAGGLGLGHKRSKAYEEFVMEKRETLRESYGLCEMACQRILSYSNNFLHKKLKTSEGGNRAKRVKGKAALGLLIPINELVQERCCADHCTRMAVTHGALLKQWREQAKSSQNEARRVIGTMLIPSGGSRPNCYKFISMVTGCSPSTISVVSEKMKETGGQVEPPVHGLKNYWKNKPREPKPPKKCKVQSLLPPDHPLSVQHKVLEKQIQKHAALLKSRRKSKTPKRLLKNINLDGLVPVSQMDNLDNAIIESLNTETLQQSMVTETQNPALTVQLMPDTSSGTEGLWLVQPTGSSANSHACKVPLEKPLDLPNQNEPTLIFENDGVIYHVVENREAVVPVIETRKFVDTGQLSCPGNATETGNLTVPVKLADGRHFTGTGKQAVSGFQSQSPQVTYAGKQIICEQMSDTGKLLRTQVAGIEKTKVNSRVIDSGGIQVIGNLTNSGQLTVTGILKDNRRLTIQEKVSVSGLDTDTGNLPVTGILMDTGELTVSGQLPGNRKLVVKAQVTITESRPSDQQETALSESSTVGGSRTGERNVTETGKFLDTGKRIVKRHVSDGQQVPLVVTRKIMDTGKSPTGKLPDTGKLLDTGKLHSGKLMNRCQAEGIGNLVEDAGFTIPVSVAESPVDGNNVTQSCRIGHLPTYSEFIAINNNSLIRNSKIAPMVLTKPKKKKIVNTSLNLGKNTIETESPVTTKAVSEESDPNLTTVATNQSPPEFVNVQAASGENSPASSQLDNVNDSDLQSVDDAEKRGSNLGFTGMIQEGFMSTLQGVEDAHLNLENICIVPQPDGTFNLICSQSELPETEQFGQDGVILDASRVPQILNLVTSGDGEVDLGSEVIVCTNPNESRLEKQDPVDLGISSQAGHKISVEEKRERGQDILVGDTQFCADGVNVLGAGNEVSSAYADNTTLVSNDSQDEIASSVLPLDSELDVEQRSSENDVASQVCDVMGTKDGAFVSNLEKISSADSSYELVRNCAPASSLDDIIDEVAHSKNTYALPKSPAYFPSKVQNLYHSKKKQHESRREISKDVRILKLNRAVESILAHREKSEPRSITSCDRGFTATDDRQKEVTSPSIGSDLLLTGSRVVHANEGNKTVLLEDSAFQSPQLTVTVLSDSLSPMSYPVDPNLGLSPGQSPLGTP